MPLDGYELSDLDRESVGYAASAIKMTLDGEGIPFELLRVYDVKSEKASEGAIPLWLAPLNESDAQPIAKAVRWLNIFLRGDFVVSDGRYVNSLICERTDHGALKELPWGGDPHSHIPTLEGARPIYLRIGECDKKIIPSHKIKEIMTNDSIGFEVYEYPERKC